MVYFVINELWALWLMLCDCCRSVMVAEGMGVLNITGLTWKNLIITILCTAPGK